MADRNSNASTGSTLADMHESSMSLKVKLAGAIALLDRSSVVDGDNDASYASHLLCEVARDLDKLAVRLDEISVHG